MFKTLPMELQNGMLYVEIEDVDLPPMPDEKGDSGFDDLPVGAKPVGFTSKVKDTAYYLKSTISTLAEDMAHALDKAAPSEWSLEFSIGFKGTASAIPVLVSSEANAALKLTLKWKKDE